MTDNLALWKRFADIDPKFTKPITGKPYKGTSPNAHYVIQCLTEMFGPVGVGFGWDVVAEGFQPLGDEVLHWCRIHFWHGDGKGFDAYGQTKALTIAKRGTPQEYLMVDEDAPKKSLTDAITKAAAQVGVASNIFLGRWDDSRYVDQVNADFRDAEKPKFNAPAAAQRIKDKLCKCKTLEQLGEAFKAEWSAIQEIGQHDSGLQAQIVNLKDQLKADLHADPARNAPPLEDGHAYQ